MWSVLHLLVRQSFSFSFDPKVISIDTSFHFKFIFMSFRMTWISKKDRNYYFLLTPIFQRPKLAFIFQWIICSLSIDNWFLLLRYSLCHIKLRQRASHHLALYIIILLFDLLLKYFHGLQYFLASETNTALNLASRWVGSLKTCRMN